MSRATECAGKRPYRTRAAATAVRDRRVANGAQPVLAAYECRWCASWHLGHAGIGTNGRSAPGRRRGRR